MDLIKQVTLEKTLVLDIETVPIVPSFQELSERMQELWSEKSDRLSKFEKEEKTPEEMFERAGIYSEFGKIVCISAGFFKKEDDEYHFRVTSYYGDDEKDLLQRFGELLMSYFPSSSTFLCGHNSKEFDFPYISRRMVINQVELPECLDVSGRKPWETGHLLDTMHMWRFGDYKHFTSLNLLAAVLDIPSPKEDIAGSDVGRVYWDENDLPKIKDYCERDVVTVAQLMMRFKGLELIPEENITNVT